MAKCAFWAILGLLSTSMLAGRTAAVAAGGDLTIAQIYAPGSGHVTTVYDQAQLTADNMRLAAAYGGWGPNRTASCQLDLTAMASDLRIAALGYVAESYGGRVDSTLLFDGSSLSVGSYLYLGTGYGETGIDGWSRATCTVHASEISVGKILYLASAYGSNGGSMDVRSSLLLQNSTLRAESFCVGGTYRGVAGSSVHGQGMVVAQDSTIVLAPSSRYTGGSLSIGGIGGTQPGAATDDSWFRNDGSVVSGRSFGLSRGATLEIIIEGDEPSDYGTFIFSDYAMLSGRLRVGFSNFVPVPGDSFDLMTAGRLSLSLEDLEITGLPNSEDWYDFRLQSVTQGANQVLRLTLVGVAPEPVTAGLGTMGLVALTEYWRIRRRRSARS